MLLISEVDEINDPGEIEEVMNKEKSPRYASAKGLKIHEYFQCYKEYSVADFQMISIPLYINSGT